MTLYEFLAEQGWWIIKSAPGNTSWVPVDEAELKGFTVTEDGEHRDSTGAVS